MDGQLRRSAKSQILSVAWQLYFFKHDDTLTTFSYNIETNLVVAVVENP